MRVDADQPVACGYRLRLPNGGDPAAGPVPGPRLAQRARRPGVHLRRPRQRCPLARTRPRSRRTPYPERPQHPVADIRGRSVGSDAVRLAPGAFVAAQLDTARLIASTATAVLTRALRHHLLTRRLTDQLIIGDALGVLKERYHLSDDDAPELIHGRSAAPEAAPSCRTATPTPSRTLATDPSLPPDADRSRAWSQAEREPADADGMGGNCSS